MTKPLMTDAEVAVMLAIRQCTRENRKAPTYQEMAEDTGHSVGAISTAVHRLECRGFIEKSARKHRSIRLVNE